MNLVNKDLFLIILCLGLTADMAKAQKVDTIQCEVEAIASLPKSLVEISGMVASDNDFWVHNDGDNGSFLMLLTKQGTIKTIKRISNAPNYDWEDIAVDPAGNLYVGDIGNNNNNRRMLQIYKIPNPARSENLRIVAEKIEFDYSDQKEFPPKKNRLVYDAEAMIYFRDTLFIFNKNRTQPYSGYLRMYKLPATIGKQKAVLGDSLFLGGKNMLSSWVTGAALSADGEKLALLSHDKVWMLEGFSGSNFFKGKLKVLKLNHFSQKEAICFDTQGNLFVADEVFEKFLGGKLYSLTVKKIAKK
jgi:hypothetical protein